LSALLEETGQEDRNLSDLGRIRSVRVRLRLGQQGRYLIQLFPTLDSDRLAQYMDIRLILIAEAFYICRLERLRNDALHVRLDKGLKLMERVP
jgi:hypothetical protein